LLAVGGLMLLMTDPLQIERDGRPIDLAGLWAPNPAFLACSGPSLDGFPLERLRERGVVSMGVNNAAARAPVKAWCFSDPQCKFHHGLYFDPGVMTFGPTPKLRWNVVVKTAEGFRGTKVRVRDCPNTYGFHRMTCFDPETFFTTPFCHWGSGKHQPKGVEPSGCLATMLIGIRLLYYLGTRRIYLLGVDHVGGRRRWAKEDKCFERLRPAFAERGLEVYNCNPTSGCRSFLHVPFDLAVQDCKGSVPDEPLDVEGWYDKKTVKEQIKANEVFRPEHF